MLTFEGGAGALKTKIAPFSLLDVADEDNILAIAAHLPAEAEFTSATQAVGMPQASSAPFRDVGEWE